MSKYLVALTIKWNDFISFQYNINNVNELKILKDKLYNSLIKLSSDYEVMDFSNVNLFIYDNKGQIIYLFDNVEVEKYVTKKNNIIYCDYPKNDKEIIFLNLLNEYKFTKNKWIDNIIKEIQKLDSFSLTFKICNYIFQIVNKLSNNKLKQIELLNIISNNGFKDYFLTYFYNITYNIDMNNNRNEYMGYLEYFLLFLDNYYSISDYDNGLPNITIMSEIIRISEKLNTKIIKLATDLQKYETEEDNEDYLSDLISDNNNNEKKQIMPSKEEINESKDMTLRKLKENKVKGYKYVDDYITTHYELLRADVLIPFQEAIQVLIIILRQLKKIN